ncbi:hypothetical protein EMIHUDRAFT_196982 [Emiliania huxleyi CCMP1516]|uniref:Right handed beta helix domain-containing protein n=2 Tax=Emiliania huxleyi TaxID=2903 RepID=A0A0D3ITI3_EMIH1|nr:hypothetical protein EMIHUDRAFT_196982 [Emiliania huxleyi CCMP1516]EOD14568.1 hypothetical protein EMIHUDRAFT_196982 [Emiliania huxleyi CCMP1516]|eukprot:XP_005766997.1 hypothetical protein EMIHUDRAFT_196982 [Emiliania huxleyi CCMP1516]
MQYRARQEHALCQWGVPVASQRPASDAESICRRSKEQLLDIFNESRMEASVNVVDGNVNLIDSTVTNCKGDWGGALYVDNSGVDNSGQDYKGGAVYVKKGEVSLSVSEISDCRAYFSGGAVYVQRGEVSLIDSKISSCSAEEAEGGAVFVDRGKVSLINSEISDCHAEDIGGALCVWGGEVRVEGSTFTSCSADKGGAIYVEEGEVNLMDSEFSNCSAAEVRIVGRVQ